jgi:hypothetical protein
MTQIKGMSHLRDSGTNQGMSHLRDCDTNQGDETFKRQRYKSREGTAKFIEMKLTV